jgi:hypothetical protein
MKVFHGSYTKIKEIDLTKSLPNKDFGQGFYVTKYRQHAENWATKMANKYKTEAFVTEFDYTESEFARRICKIKHFDTYDDEWLNFVAMNRDKKAKNPAHDYDIVEGPVADDKVQITLNLYLKGKISKEKFLKILAYHEQTHQICFCTFNSLQLLDYIENTDINCETMEMSELLIEKLTIDKQINETLAADLFYSSQTFAQLADENTLFYKKTWQEIYEALKTEIQSCEFSRLKM